MEMIVEFETFWTWIIIYNNTYLSCLLDNLIYIFFICYSLKSVLKPKYIDLKLRITTICYVREYKPYCKRDWYYLNFFPMIVKHLYPKRQLTYPFNFINAETLSLTKFKRFPNDNDWILFMIVRVLQYRWESFVIIHKKKKFFRVIIFLNYFKLALNDPER